MLKHLQDQSLRHQVADDADSPQMELHSRCGVYTQVDQVKTVLDAIGWTAKTDLSSASILEPAAGNGAFIDEIVARLLAAFKRSKRPLSAKNLCDRVRAFEFVGREATAMRKKVRAQLIAEGMAPAGARIVASTWIQTADFLLWQADRKFTHVAGNPPYCRWSKVPLPLRERYSANLPSYVARGDIFLPFLDKAIDLLSPAGVLGFVCSDRWKWMGFADEFRKRRLPTVTIERDESLAATAAFQRDVDAYSSLLVMRPKTHGRKPTHTIKRRPTLIDSGFRVRVGPALGCTAAFVLEPTDLTIEHQLLAPFLDGRDILDQQILPSGKRVVVMHDTQGRLIDLKKFPKAESHFRRFSTQLRSRAKVRLDKAVWYSPIDRVRRGDWDDRKLLVPELAKVPRFALDISGAIPSHGVYAVFGPSPQALDELMMHWAEGGLAASLAGRVPQVKGGYYRCYKRFLDQLEVPD